MQISPSQTPPSEESYTINHTLKWITDPFYVATVYSPAALDHSM